MKKKFKFLFFADFFLFVLESHKNYILAGFWTFLVQKNIFRDESLIIGHLAGILVPAAGVLVPAAGMLAR